MNKRESELVNNCPLPDPQNVSHRTLLIVKENYGKFSAARIMEIADGRRHWILTSGVKVHENDYEWCYVSDAWNAVNQT